MVQPSCASPLLEAHAGQRASWVPKRTPPSIKRDSRLQIALQLVAASKLDLQRYGSMCEVSSLSCPSAPPLPPVPRPCPAADTNLPVLEIKMLHMMTSLGELSKKQHETQ